jgi:hypothetical protein
MAKAASASEWFVFVEESVRVAVVNSYVLGEQDDGLAGEAVAEGVQFRALLAGFGAGAVEYWALTLFTAARLVARAMVAGPAAPSWPLGTVDCVLGFITSE